MIPFHSVDEMDEQEKSEGVDRRKFLIQSAGGLVGMGLALALPGDVGVRASTEEEIFGTQGGPGGRPGPDFPDPYYP
jgi:hypothetical protein